MGQAMRLERRSGPWQCTRPVRAHSPTPTMRLALTRLPPHTPCTHHNYPPQVRSAQVLRAQMLAACGRDPQGALLAGQGHPAPADALLLVGGSHPVRRLPLVRRWGLVASGEGIQDKQAAGLAQHDLLGCAMPAHASLRLPLASVLPLRLTSHMTRVLARVAAWPPHAPP